MDYSTILLIFALLSGFYMAWSIGANDVANAMGTSVGSGALTVKRAVIIAAVLEFAGAFFAGSHVSQTIRKGIINPNMFAGHEMDLVFGMIGALLAAAIWLQIASYNGWPVSTTHSIVGAVLGFGVAYGGIHAADWAKVGSIVASWVVSPLLSGSIAFALFSLLRNLIYKNPNPIRATKKVTPFIVFVVFLVLTLAMVFKGLKNLHLDLDFGESFLVGIIIGLLAAGISILLLRRIDEKELIDTKKRRPDSQAPNIGKRVDKAITQIEKALSRVEDPSAQTRLESIKEELRAFEKDLDLQSGMDRDSQEFKTVERIFIYLQILSASFVAFAHGANDVANSVGPLAAVVTILQTGEIAMKSPVPVWILVLGGVGIVIGLATWGWRVMLTIGKKITELTPTRGFSAEFATATTLVLASKLGLPVSTTHTLVGGVLGVGFARGIKALNLQVVNNIIISWVVTIPAGAFGALIIYYLLKAVFG